MMRTLRDDRDKSKVLNFEKLLANKIELVDDEISKLIPRVGGIPNLHDAIWHTISAGGKRLRPVMCLLVAETLNGDRVKALRFAAAVELIHSFLLIHDDIEDQDVVRRNRPSLWVKYGLAHAVNSGDYIIPKVYETILGLRQLSLDESKLIDLLDAVTVCLKETGEGQAMEINTRKKDMLNEDEYLEVIRKKTGYYLTLPIIGAAIISGAPTDVMTSIRRYGNFVGPAFQIHDDVIDLTKGKGRGERGCDIKEGKRSFLVVHAMSKCTLQERKTLLALLNKPREKKTKEDIEWVTILFDRYKSVDAGVKKAHELVKQGKEEISNVPQRLKKLLYGFANFAIERSY